MTKLIKRSLTKNWVENDSGKRLIDYLDAPAKKVGHRVACLPTGEA